MSERKVVRAGLVARGFDEDSSNLRTNSPTCTRQSMCLVFLTAASNKWEIKSLDIKAAFLHGYKWKEMFFSDHQVIIALKIRFGNYRDAFIY